MPDFEQVQPELPHIILVVDESGSMASSTDATLSSVNEYIEGLRSKLPAASPVTVVKFDSSTASFGLTASASLAGMTAASVKSLDTVRISKILDKAALGDARKITREDYQPNGMTPLNDAIGRTIVAVDDDLKATPGPVFFAIITDGAENASREFKLANVKKMIEERTEKGWTFAFIGVDIDAYQAGSGYGVSGASIVSASRATYGSAVNSMTRGVGDKYAMFASMAEMDAEARTTMYSAFNKTDALFNAEEKAAAEKDKK